jgi:Fe-S-cluster containining protein
MASEQTTNPIEEYRRLRSRIDEQVKRLEGFHGTGITCHPGCAACCVILTVFPVEFFAILEDIGRARIRQEALVFDRSAPCGFLNEKKLCRIYRFRPIICRTHGLPVLFLNDSQEEPAWEVSFCELNFHNKTGIEFTDETLLDIETINAGLNRINDQYTSSPPGNKYSARERIPLRNLIETVQGVKSG